MDVEGEGRSAASKERKAPLCRFPQPRGSRPKQNHQKFKRQALGKSLNIKLAPEFVWKGSNIFLFVIILPTEASKLGLAMTFQ